MKLLDRVISLALMALFFTPSFSQDTDVIYLSGTGFDQTVEWDFYCTAGMNSGAWTTIAVPSCWEQQGFGAYNYGHVPFEERLKEEGHYRYVFELPEKLRGKHVDLVFEGVMTDCRVVLNGEPAGEVHRGAFYPFRYNVTQLLHYGGQNRLEVFVKKFSDNMSVNQAERKADYWVFGGIFRPVYLEVKPARHIERVAADARADGAFRADVYLSEKAEGGKVEVRILDASGAVVAGFDAAVPSRERILRVEGVVDAPETWSPEFPHLYTAEFTLLDNGEAPVHRESVRIGFRTVEVREQDGIYVNGERIKFKGVNRHSFHPDHGRTSSRAFSIEAVNLIKDMNMNAVRMSHYPPDAHFLDICDSLGLFVLDELAGWQWPPYDSVVGRKLLAGMIARDVNHPSVVMWDNGNEGGWNTAYDGDFGELDIQQREVNHPWGVHGKSNTAHYVEYNYLSQDHFAPRSIFFPTEMIHGLYDGGHAAGLEDFWLRMWEHPLSAGGFLWVFADEAAKRSDTGLLDTDGNHAPDGILGPYHEKEASFYAIREIWSPVHFEKRYITTEFNGRFRIRNRYHYTGMERCSFIYRWIALQGPDAAGGIEIDGTEIGKVMEEGIPRVDPLEPGQAGYLEVPLMENWMEADVLCVEAWDPHGRLIHCWSWPVKTPAVVAAELIQPDPPDEETVTVSEQGNTIILESGGVSMQLGKLDGRVKKVTAGGREIPLKNGPVFGSGTLQIKEFNHFERDGSHCASVIFENGSNLEWVMHPGGLVEMNLRYQPGGGHIPFTGASFDYPEAQVRSVRYMGDGPYRVWKNRMAGVRFSVWEKPYNNTITGHSGYQYPEFKGYFSNLYWARVFDPDDRYFTVFSRSEDLFLRLFTPGEAPDPAHTAVLHPGGDLSFMKGIPAIGTKFKEAEELGPQSNNYIYQNRWVKDGALQVNLTFDFRNYK